MNKEFKLFDKTMSELTARKEKIKNKGECVVASYLPKDGVPKVCFIGDGEQIFAVCMGIIGMLGKTITGITDTETARKMITEGVAHALYVYLNEPEVAIDLDEFKRQAGLADE